MSWLDLLQVVYCAAGECSKHHWPTGARGLLPACHCWGSGLPALLRGMLCTIMPAQAGAYAACRHQMIWHRLEDAKQADAASTNGQRVYMANCLIAIAGALGGHPCCQGRIRQLHAEADRQVAELVQAEASTRLSVWGLAEIVERIRYAEIGTTPNQAKIITWDVGCAPLVRFVRTS